jgi:hypothetical protein
MVDGAEWPERLRGKPSAGTPRLPPGGGMTAEALSATEAGTSPRSAAAGGTSPGEPADGSAELAEARQSVVDLVAARLAQVDGPEAAVNGTHPGAPPAEPTAGAASEPPADRDRTGVVPGDRAPADRARTEAPADRAPADRVPADRAPADRARTEAPAGQAPADQSRTGVVAADDAPPHDGRTDELAAGAGVTAAGVALDGAAAGVGERDVLGEVRELLPTDDPATAVLDVLRACGWADAEEVRKLRAEAERMRELLDLVVRDHRAREASAAGLETQQHHWLIPLLRAAHGVAFGSLGAKVALRTAVQDVPEQILATAGLRIDYGVEPAGEAQEEHWH